MPKQSKKPRIKDLDGHIGGMEKQDKGNNSSNKVLEFLNVQKLRNTLCRISSFASSVQVV